MVHKMGRTKSGCPMALLRPLGREAWAQKDGVWWTGYLDQGEVAEDRRFGEWGQVNGNLVAMGRCTGGAGVWVWAWAWGQQEASLCQATSFLR
jgi:hypothetical protein